MTIQDNIDTIRGAVNGKDVREAIAQLGEAVRDIPDVSGSLDDLNTAVTNANNITATIEAKANNAADKAATTAATNAVNNITNQLKAAQADANQTIVDLDNANKQVNKQLIDAQAVIDSNATTLAQVQEQSENIQSIASENQAIINKAGAATKEQIGAINASLAEKAEKVDLQTQKLRIDSLTSLAEGSTTGDAELIDARTVDGVTYSNAGGAIRAVSDNIKRSQLIFKNSNKLNSCIKRLELINFPSDAKVMCGMVRKSYTKNGTQAPQSVVGFYPINEKGLPIASKGMIVYLKEWEVNKDTTRALRTKYNGVNVIINATINLSTIDTDSTYNPYSYDTGAVNDICFKSNYSINPCIETVYNDMPILTLIDDDAKYGFITKAKPILDELGLKCSLAVITDNVPIATQGKTLTLDELKALKAEGYDIISHSATHGENIYKPGVATATDAEILEDMERSYNYLKDNGMKTDTIVYPWGGFADVSRYTKLAKTYYKYGVNASGGVITDEVLYDMYLDRIFLTDSTDLDTYKSYIDNTIGNNGWLILGCHSYTSQVSSDRIREVLTYAKETGINIMTFSNAIKKKRNICSIGNYGDPGNSLFIGRNGVIKNT